MTLILKTISILSFEKNQYIHTGHGAGDTGMGVDIREGSADGSFDGMSLISAGDGALVSVDDSVKLDIDDGNGAA